MPLQRPDVDGDHTLFGDAVRRFIEKDVTPHFIAWEENGIVDECPQLLGGCGFMREDEIYRLYADARVQRICGGTSEIMREPISRGL